ncbi:MULTISPECIES: helix-turn-helix domain-containing protein [unclassified Beijerinckia]|uniref:helix-turn-helix domain-containing protein n=1 Tax=unclassified Beijerinckia TaxID=2638183 RepID=UPI00089C2A5F|nr:MULTISPECIES: helix-turn-helix domain-containing protein [unclassified Beijerinckia]MDH7797515.1 hypothetical protein [Beijerinckia sp. GAS462]SEC88666.1 hypothetical protein SAMN05443249_3809 [Beijerinckia sp. 28-YEA-48]
MTEPIILKPYSKAEAARIAEAAELAGVSIETIRRWTVIYGLGRKVGGTWFISKVALFMFLEDDETALAAYHQGDRTSPVVATYFQRL